jgi:late competence protein required for DNA uptake (superfamily II DNA/RNA helicase)
VTVTARRTPYRDTRPGTYVCARCGITKTRHVGRRHSGYCRDCRDVLALERKG